MYEIIVADDQELFRAGIITLLSQAGGKWPAISEVSDWIRLRARIRTTQASLVVVSVSLILDMQLLVEQARNAHGRVLLVAEDSDFLNCYRATGVAGVMHRSASASTFLQTIQKIETGADFVLVPADRTQGRALGRRLEESLTPAEMRILALLMEGCKNRRIAEYLDVAEHVVKGRLQKIFDKTGFSTRLELAIFLETGR